MTDTVVVTPTKHPLPLHEVTSEHGHPHWFEGGGGEEYRRSLPPPWKVKKNHM